MNVLPRAQSNLWPELKNIPSHFVLYGGTAIALQLEHRESIDFDFFGSEYFNPDTLLNTLPMLKNAQVTQRAENTLSVKIDRGGSVFLSFFGLPEIKPIVKSKVTDDGVMKIASLIDLAGMKASVVQKRAEWKDYVDLVALMDAGITLPMALSAAQFIYKNQFNPQITLKALSYFDDVKGITLDIKSRLQEAVRRVDIQNLPTLNEIQKISLDNDSACRPRTNSISPIKCVERQKAAYGLNQREWP